MADLGPTDHGRPAALVVEGTLSCQTSLGVARIRGSGGADIGEEAVDVGAQRLRLLAELLGRDEDLIRRGAGLAGRLVDAGDRARHLTGALRRLLHVARDLLRRRALLLDRRGDRRRDLVDRTDRPADAL